MRIGWFIFLLFSAGQLFVFAVDRSEDQQMETERGRLEKAKQAQAGNDTDEMHYVRHACLLLRISMFLCFFIREI